MREDAFKNDAIWATFTQIDSALNSFSDVAKANPEFGDLKKQVEFVRWVLERCDPNLITQAEMNQTRGELNQIVSYLPNDAVNWQYLGAIESQLSLSLGRFSQIRQKRLTRSESANLIAELKSEIKKLEYSLEEASTVTNERVSAVKDAVTAEQLRLKQVQDEISKIEVLVATKFEAWEAKIEADYQGKIAGWTSEVSSTQVKSNDQLSVILKQFSDNIETSRQTIDGMSSALENDREKAESLLSSLYSKMKKDGEVTLKDLVGIYEQAGEVALSGGFVEAALKEEASYRSYAKSASGFFIGSAIALGIIWYDSVENKLSGLSDVILRIPISIVFLLPAFYFASLASKHRKTAVSLRSLGLRIKAFDAYTIRATEKDRQKLREELAPVFFDEERTVIGNSLGDEVFIGKIVERFGSVVEKAVDKLPFGKN